MHAPRFTVPAISTAFDTEVSRRTLLRGATTGGLAAALSPGLLRLAPGAAAQEATPSAAPAAHRYPLGDVEVIVLSDGTATVPGAFYAINAGPQELAASLAEIGMTPEALTAALNIMLIDTGEELVLIDTGLGPIQPTSGQLLASLEAEGISPDEIDIVLLTHLHLDHFGAVADADGALVFPNARHLLNRAEHEYWTTDPTLTDLPLPEEFRQLFRDTTRAVLGVLEGTVELIEPDTEIASGVTVLAAPGHTPGHLAVEVVSGEERLLHIVDAAGHPALHLAHPDWFFAPDNWPAFEILTRRALFDRAADENLLVQTYHFPFPGVGRVTKDGDGWLWEPAM
jgi:glyoxylase-like metal-dependent hydrolase (beta-lactamase superfamily II)